VLVLAIVIDDHLDAVEAGVEGDLKDFFQGERVEAARRQDQFHGKSKIERCSFSVLSPCLRERGLPRPGTGGSLPTAAGSPARRRSSPESPGGRRSAPRRSPAG